MKIAIIDSGIHPGHPHVGEVAGLVGITSAGETDEGIDRLGHGTAVAAAIREKAPDAELYAIKVFDRKLSAPITVILRALEWCRQHHMDLVNLSLGTQNPAHRDGFVRAIAGDLLVMSAAGSLPGDLSGVIGVAADSHCPRESFSYHNGVFYASLYPRAIPGVPVNLNLHGISFAVANMTGFAARILASGVPDDFTPAGLRKALIARAAGKPLSL